MTTLPALIKQTVKEVEDVLELIDVAEAQIAAARSRHPRYADTLWHSFNLLRPDLDRFKRLGYPTVYAAHCRELLDRIAADADLRPATAAEICCVMTEVITVTPITSSARGLLFRAWVAAGLPDESGIAELHHRHEALEGGLIDDHETDLRQRLSDPTRTRSPIRCAGMHHGRAVACQYTTSERNPKP